MVPRFATPQRKAETEGKVLKSNGVARGRDTKSARLKLLRDKAKRAKAVKAAKKGEKRAVAQATQATKNSAKTATEKLIAPRAWWVAVVMAVVLLFVFIISVLFGKATAGQHVLSDARNTVAGAKAVEVLPQAPRPAGLELALANDIRWVARPARPVAPPRQRPANQAGRNPSLSFRHHMLEPCSKRRVF